jgi:hypothetical protein
MKVTRRLTQESRLMLPVDPLTRQLRHLLTDPIATAAAVPDANRYRKHFSADAHLWSLVWHGLAASPSLRQTHAQLDDPAFWDRLGLPPSGISRSQFARSTVSRPLACITSLYTTLRDRIGAPRSRQDPIHLVDSSFLGLSANLSPWSKHGGHAAGVRVHTGFDLESAIPTHLTITGAETPDISAFRDRDWTDLTGWTVLMDLGYYGHQLFATLREAEVSWICPLHPQASFVVTATIPGPWWPTAAGDTMVADQTIRLGSPNNRRGAVLDAMRLITSVNAHGEAHRTVTDRFDLSPADVVSLYRQRWQIELFFRWIKHQLTVLHPLGTSRQAVIVTLYLAAIVTILGELLAAKHNANVTDIAWVKHLAQKLYLTILILDDS